MERSLGGGALGVTKVTEVEAGCVVIELVVETGDDTATGTELVRDTGVGVGDTKFLN